MILILIFFLIAASQRVGTNNLCPEQIADLFGICSFCFNQKERLHIEAKYTDQFFVNHPVLSTRQVKRQVQVA